MNDTQRPQTGSDPRGGPTPARFDRGAAAVALRHPEHLRRSTTDRKLAGVCAGLGRQMGIDPTILRVAMVALALSGLGIALYFILWIVMPEEGDPRPDTAVTRALPEQLRSGTGLAVAIGGGTVGLGIALAAVFGDVLPFNFPLPFPLILVAAVVLFFWYRSRESSQKVVTEFRAQHPTGPQLDVSRDPADPGAPGPQFWARPDPLGLYTDTTAAVPAPTEASSPVPAARTRRAPALLRGGTFLATAASVGVLGIVAGAGVAIAPLLWIGVPLVVLGSGLLVTSRYGSAGGLATLGVAGAVAASGLAAVGPLDLADHTWRPTTIAQAQALTLHPGRNVVDLSNLTVPANKAAALDLSQTNGVLEVILPADLDVTANTNVTRGGYELFDTVRGGGFSSARDAGSPSTYTDNGADGPAADDQHLTLDLDVINGYVEVRRSTP